MPAGPLQALGALLDQGVDVALIYGDRDFRCNCNVPSHTPGVRAI